MAKYLSIWEMDMNKVPIDPKERAAAWMQMQDMVEQDMKRGILKDWGIFTGEMRGFSVSEGTRIEVNDMVQQYIPFISVTVHEITSLNEVRESTKNLAK
jgi:hypothetical protein